MSLCSREEIMKSSRIYLRVTDEEKLLIEKLASEGGYKTVSSFLLASAKTHTVFNFDVEAVYHLSSEINYIGHNINTLIKKIYSYDFYTESDLVELKNGLSAIESLIQEYYSEIKNISKKLNKTNFSILDIIPYFSELNFKNKELTTEDNFLLIEELEKIFIFVESVLVYELKAEERVTLFNDLINVDKLFSFSKEQLIEFYKELFPCFKKIKMLVTMKKVSELNSELLRYAQILRKQFANGDS